MDKLSRDVFGNVSFTKQLKENKSFSASKMKIYHDYNCKLFKSTNKNKSGGYSNFNHTLIYFKISLN